MSSSKFGSAEPGGGMRSLAGFYVLHEIGQYLISKPDRRRSRRYKINLQIFFDR